MNDIIDKDECIPYYEDVRDDNTETNWVVFVYNGDKIVYGAHGTDFEELKKMCTDDERCFGYVRIMTGDCMSKRAKFAFITWIGELVSPIKRGKVSTDKAFVKQVAPNFAKEFMTSDKNELNLDYIREELKKAGGANYDAQAK